MANECETTWDDIDVMITTSCEFIYHEKIKSKYFISTFITNYFKNIHQFSTICILTVFSLYIFFKLKR